mmetsp:Transcript_5603/g.21169  ORF Transcript_5603/g.21169 Transcript_5603/m.21169 type:complete len:900 (-) Transcript_5603:57-2756(-)
MAPSLPALEEPQQPQKQQLQEQQRRPQMSIDAPPSLHGAVAAPGRQTPTGVPRLCPSLSEPSVTLTWTTGSFPVARRLRPGSGRFRSDEMTCFKKLPLPSAAFPQKAEVYCQGTFARKRAMSDSGLHTLPAMKGDFYRFSPDHFHPPAASVTSSRSEFLQEVEELPQERSTATVLNQIYPCPQDPLERQRKATVLKRTGSVRTVSRCSAVVKPSTGNEAQRSLLSFRQKLLERFATMQSAFAQFAGETSGGMERELPRKNFSRFLDKNFSGLSHDDHARIFDFLDTNKNGVISIAEFHTAIEAAAPVRSMEDLRRRLIALGYTSMRQALREMDAASGNKKNLGVTDFAQGLTRVGVLEESEHQILFETLRDPYAGAKTVTLEQLHCALQAVSPIMLLEDIRDKILAKCGSVQAAFTSLDTDSSNTVSIPEFVRMATHVWRMTHYEATKAFKLIDCDNSKVISRREFVTAMNLSEPSLFLEDIRRKVRQRFRSIAEALLGDQGSDDSMLSAPKLKEEGGGASQWPPSAGGSGSGGHLGLPGGGLGDGLEALRSKTSGSGAAVHNDISASDVWSAFNNAAVHEEALQAQTPSMLRETLSKVQLTDSETTLLFAIVDINGDGELTPLEFSKGIRFFAPACVLDDLRLRCLASHSRVADAFAAISVERRGVVLHTEGMREVLAELEMLEGVHVEAIVDLLEPHKEGGLTVSELIAALQSAAPGSLIPLTAELRDARARQQVKSQMSPFLCTARDLRADVRQKVPKEDGELLPRLRSIASRLPAMGTVAEEAHDEDDQSEPAFKKTALGAVSHKSLVTPWPLQSSYNKVSRQVRQVLPPTDSKPIVQRLQGYYTTAGHTVASHGDLLATSPSRFGNWSALSNHRAVISRPATTKVGEFREQPPP